jgi:hypothetical protein
MEGGLRNSLKNIAILVGVSIFALVGFLRITSGHWLWKHYDFKQSNWGMSPQQVFEEEDLSGRPSGSENLPEIVRLNDHISYFKADCSHFMPIYKPIKEPTRIYIFNRDKLFAGVEIFGGKDIVYTTDKKIRAFTAKYGEPLIKKTDSWWNITVWSADNRSYCAIMPFVNKNVSFSFEIQGERHTVETGNYITINVISYDKAISVDRLDELTGILREVL